MQDAKKQGESRKEKGREKRRTILRLREEGGKEGKRERERKEGEEAKKDRIWLLIVLMP